MDNGSEDEGEVGSRDLFRFLKCPSHLPGSRLTGGQEGVENGRRLGKPSVFSRFASWIKAYCVTTLFLGGVLFRQDPFLCCKVLLWICSVSIFTWNNSTATQEHNYNSGARVERAHNLADKLSAPYVSRVFLPKRSHPTHFNTTVQHLS